MSGFLYFLETPKKALSAEDLVAAGLGHALKEGRGVVCLQTYSGPGDRAGVLCAIDGDVPAPSYKPAEQTWRKGPGGKFWAGVANDAKPGPEDLARPRGYGGEPVTLGDGSEWLVARCFGVLPDRPATLPRVLDLDDDGEGLITRVHPKYGRLQGEVSAFWAAFLGADGAEPFDGGRRVNLAVDVLGVNYRVGKVEALALLGLFDTETLGRVLRAAVDADAVEAHFPAEGAPAPDPDVEEPAAR